MNERRVIMKTARGGWVPAIPLPYAGLRKRCSCGRRFWTTEGYREHYALAHILEAARKPVRCPGCDARPDEPHDAGCHGGDPYFPESDA